ncbi:hypothetical protein DPMN_114422 [Dreissena polymorpha]|uniref:Uncharacterized protein n=1 Tax=Dreissena polymorpha TaxID=45954 RepID=A0A9D4KK46_DREPO|nr:hypothetical protein DPMN_114422 [Dreissena polymorpha]
MTDNDRTNNLCERLQQNVALAITSSIQRASCQRHRNCRRNYCRSAMPRSVY